MVLAILFTLLFAELALRAGIAIGSKALREPSLYANSLGDDDYWLLRHRWNRDGGSPFGRNVVHPTLGWAPAQTEQNPLGIHRRGRYVPDYDGDVVLFFGDSFVAGDLPDQLETELEAQLSVRRLPSSSNSPTIYNYGVGGYGVDQILLRFELSHSQFSNPVILFGMLLTDLDRSVLKIRDAPKPHFEIDDGELVLNEVPLPEDPEEHLLRASPSFKSYLLALVRQRWRRSREREVGLETAYRREEKMELNRLLLERAQATALERDIPLHFMLLYTQGGLASQGWREKFVKSELERLGADYFDSKPALLTGAEEAGVRWQHYYLPDGHHTREGNRVIVVALAAYLAGQPRWSH